MLRNLLLTITLSFAMFSTAMAAECDSPPKEATQDKLPEKEELMPSFLGGDSPKKETEKLNTPAQFEGRNLVAFKCWVLQHLRFSGKELAAGQSGSVLVSFIITKKGLLTNVVSLPGSVESFAPAVVALMAQSPAWTPALRNGKPVESKHILGFDIQLCTADGVDGFYSEDNTAYAEVDTMPVFGNGTVGIFDGWVKECVEKHFGGDTAILKGTVPLEFVVEKDGSMSEINVGNAPNAILAWAVGEVAAKAPVWNPGVFFGKKVRVGMSVPICFGEFPDSVATQVRVMAEMMPEFYGGGLDRFRNWVMQQVEYPEKALRNNIQGRVSVAFVVEKDGSLSDVRVLSSPDLCLSNEVLAVMERSPKWTPGVQDGKVVRVQYTLPVDFKFPEAPSLPNPPEIDSPNRN